MEQILSSKKIYNRIIMIRWIFDSNALDFDAWRMQHSVCVPLQCIPSLSRIKYLYLIVILPLSINHSLHDKKKYIWLFVFFSFIFRNLRKGLFAAQTILISMALSVPYLPLSQSDIPVWYLVTDFKSTISGKSSISNFLFAKRTSS